MKATTLGTFSLVAGLILAGGWYIGFSESTMKVLLFSGCIPAADNLFKDCVGINGEEVWFLSMWVITVLTGMVVGVRRLRRWALQNAIPPKSSS